MSEVQFRIVEPGKVVETEEDRVLAQVAGGEVAFLHPEVHERIRSAREMEREREGSILAAGWEPWRPPESRWVFDPFLKPVKSEQPAGALGLTFLGMAVALLMPFLFVLGSGEWRWASILGGLLVLTVLLMFLFAMVWDERGTESAKESQALRSTVRGRYEHILPGKVLTKAHQDAHLFDTLYVTSPNARLFEDVHGYLSPLSDPFLVGRVGTKLYLGAVWGLKADLAKILEETQGWTISTSSFLSSSGGAGGSVSGNADS